MFLQTIVNSIVKSDEFRRAVNRGVIEGFEQAERDASDPKIKAIIHQMVERAKETLKT